MFKLSEIKELIKLVDSTTVQELEIENEGSRLLIRKPNKTESVVVAHAPAPQSYIPVASHPVSAPVQTAAAPTEAAAAPAPAAKAEADAGYHKITSPMVGTFYRASAPGAAPFVNVGDRVNEKTTVCILEAMKLMNPIEAEVKGEIVEILAENGQLVEYGQTLFLVKPE
ncbi:acetyl-CoA carboxylase biotin carboxyl carrier protein [Paenibacillus flagellatus]|uniref:Biotin carboxyl carrier protein of acetyl-CoA carboxylase n=1 Tax=Paenibacillus flagellatus TaxID=2211139 RepID=A0A2V5KYK5_9BACL|nr:acetyl-CoA carboxylase biotin carboxyl carrier protein [Paenibacillus flagellatus]PYI55056.1 acetyl-CoA carboxylase biotin carboxyl carrier protein [Paenibacillus flagellatus]